MVGVGDNIIEGRRPIGVGQKNIVLEEEECGIIWHSLNHVCGHDSHPHGWQRLLAVSCARGSACMQETDTGLLQR